MIPERSYKLEENVDEKDIIEALINLGYQRFADSIRPERYLYFGRGPLSGVFFGPKVRINVTEKPFIVYMKSFTSKPLNELKKLLEE